MLIQVLKMRFPQLFGHPVQHFTLDKLHEIKAILENPPYHICNKSKTLTVTFDIEQDLKHEQFNLDYHIHIKKLERQLEIKNKSNSIHERILQ